MESPAEVEMMQWKDYGSRVLCLAQFVSMTKSTACKPTDKTYLSVVCNLGHQIAERKGVGSVSALVGTRHSSILWYRQIPLLSFWLEFCRDYVYNASLMTLAAQMSSNISILIGSCLLHNVDDYWHNIFTCKGTAELCFSTYMLKNTG